MNIKKYIDRFGLIGVYIFTISLMVSKAGMNIGLGIMLFSFLFLNKKEEIINLELEEKHMLFLIILIPIFSLFSIGGMKSFLISLEKIYRYLPIFFIPIFLKKSKKYYNIIYCVYITIFINFINGIKFYQSKNWNFNLRYQSYGVSLLDDAHMFAMLSFIVLGIIFYLINNKKSYINIFLSIVIYIISLSGLLFSQTRGAWLSLLGGLLFFLYFTLKNKKTLISIVVLTLLFSYVLNNTEKFEKNRYIRRWSSITDIKNDSPKIRIIMWKGAVYSFKKHFIFGTGKDNSAKDILEYIDKNNKYSEVNNKNMLKVIAETGNMHNMYFSSLAEEGVLFFYLLWVWGFILWKEIEFYKELDSKKIEYYIISSCIALTVAFYITGLTENAWKNMWKTNTYLFGIGMYLTLKKIKKVNNAKEKNTILY